MIFRVLGQPPRARSCAPPSPFTGAISPTTRGADAPEIERRSRANHSSQLIRPILTPRPFEIVDSGRSYAPVFSVRSEIPAARRSAALSSFFRRRASHFRASQIDPYARPRTTARATILAITSIVSTRSLTFYSLQFTPSHRERAAAFVSSLTRQMPGAPGILTLRRGGADARAMPLGRRTRQDPTSHVFAGGPRLQGVCICLRMQRLRVRFGRATPQRHPRRT